MKTMTWISVAIALAAIAKLWMVENRVIALEKQVGTVTELSILTNKATRISQEIQRLKELQEAQMQVEVYEEPKPSPMQWLQL